VVVNTRNNNITQQPATVIHVSEMRQGDVYIGRDFSGFKNIGWGNPFKLRLGEPSGTTLERYREWLLKQPQLMARLGELRGKRLACWCKKPRHRETPCHGDILVEILSTIE
jgi:hypothetical protein